MTTAWTMETGLCWVCGDVADCATARRGDGHIVASLCEGCAGDAWWTATDEDARTLARFRRAGGDE